VSSRVARLRLLFVARQQRRSCPPGAGGRLAPGGDLGKIEEMFREMPVRQRSFSMWTSRSGAVLRVLDQ